ncbi:MAG: amino acid adenylation domain-containing protein, partial [Bacteroidota bacterium]
HKLPMSFAQERLWFIDKLDGSLAYNMPSVLKLKGAINIEVLEYSFNAIVNRHEVLRTVYQAEEGQPYQVVLPKDQWKLNVTDLTENADVGKVDERIESEIKQAFDLANDYMLRANLLKVAEDEFVLIMIIHHIASDGWSNPILVNEIVSFYKAKIAGEEAGLSDLPIQYLDYAVWQKEYLTGEVLNQKLSYWEKKLKGTEPINLPTDFVRPAIQSTNGRTVGMTIDQKTSEQVAALAKETGTTLSMILLSVLKILLSRYSGQNDICVGMPIANRSAAEVESLIGFFVNTLALRSNLNEEVAFADFIREMKQVMLEAFNHQDVPFEKIVDRVESGRDMSRNPIFQVAYTFNNTEDIPDLDLGGATLEMMPFVDETTPYDLSWDLESTKEGIRIDVQYCTDLFQGATVERMLAHFGQLLASAVSQSDLAISRLNMLLPEEEALILGQKATASGDWFNRAEKDLGNTLPINVRFENCAAEYGEATAVVHGDVRWNYQQVNDFANQIAHSLSDMGVEPGHFVGVYAERNPALLSALLGIIKIGAVYVPLDTQNPTERIEKMIANSQMSAIISTDALVAQLEEVATDKVLLFDEAGAALRARVEKANGQLVDRTMIDNANTENPANPNQMDSWAYMLFTSGSTGEPKGAITRHDGAMNHILAEYELLELEDGFNFLQSAGIGSDISLWQMLAPVLKGGSVVIVDKFDILNYDAIIQLMSEEQISIVEFVPSYIWGLVERLKEMPKRPAMESLKWIMMVGEQVPVKLVNDFRDLYPQVRILNGYGPCEASDDITQYEVIGKLDPKLNRVPIGRSLTNMNMFVVDTNGALCPVGIAGELCVSGVGVGAGYFGMPEKTAAAFIKNPFPGTLGEVLYRTGDLGRWLPDGNLEFLGRIDRQVKIRGHRVELGEIETYIREDKMVKDAHIMVHRSEEEGAQDALVAFVVVDENQGVEQRVIGKPIINKVDQKIEAHNEANPHLASQLIELEKGIKAYALNKSESLFAYNEIFEEQAYLINGISLKPGDVVFDVGANVGMFSMYVSLHFPGSEIYSFEPLPPTFEIMNSNCIVYGDQAKIKAYKAGLSDKNQKVTFTHYPDNSMLSGRYGDLEEDKSYVRNVLERQLRDEEDQDTDIQILVDKTMNYEEYECQLLSLSEVVEENNIQQIDLLKVDVERSELDVLMGIKPEHWPLIKQIVIEVHDDGNSLDKVKEFLDTYGYSYLVEQEDLLVGTHLYNIYAVRKDAEEVSTVENVTPELIGLEMINKDLFAHCQDGLPAYMQPTEYCFVEKIPLNLSDKVDQKQLKVILEAEREKTSGQTSFKDGKPCTTETEKSILAIWEAILDRKGIGADEDFFEAGGHSLLAMRVKAALQKEMDIEVDIRDLFLYKSIEELADYIDTREMGNTQPALSVQERPAQIPLSFAQERLWFIDKLEGSVHYQIPLALRLTGDLDSSVLEYAIQQIINRHEILRTVYKDNGGVGTQEVLDQDQWTLELKVSPELKEQDQLLAYVERETARPFDLSSDHMIRAQLLKIEEGNHVLVFVLHHIAFDGWSESIIVNEFKELYSAKIENRAPQLEALPIQYADYAIWQKDYLNETVLDEKLNYWEEKLAGVEPLNLPLDFTRPSVQSTKGKSVQYKIGLDVKKQLETLSKNEGSTMYMTLMSAFKVMLYRYTGQTDICIASPSANRMQEEVAEMIGFFLNTIVLRNDLSNNPSFRELLGRVKLNSLEAYSHQDVPFEKIIDRVVKVRDMSRNALAEVVFVHQHVPDQSIGSLGELQLDEIEFNSEQSYADVHFTVIETEEGLEIIVNYCTALFKEETIQRLMRHYEMLLQSIIQDPAQNIGQLGMLTEAEQNQLIFAYNNTVEQYPKTATLVNLFEKKAAQLPNATALVFGNKSYTYEALNQQANKLARHLRDDMGVQTGDFIGVMMERSAWSVISILGILKA